MNEAVTTGADRPARAGGILQGIVIGVMGALYAFVIGAALFYLIQMAQAGISGYGWLVLLLPVIVPMIIFVIALAIGRKHSIGVFVVTMLAGFCLSGVFWLDTLSYALRNGASLLG